MTRDNLKKRHLNKPEDCVFCSEDESIDHLFFQCLVAKQVWNIISQFFGFAIGNDYLSVAKNWILNKKHAVLNSVCSAVLWCLWKFRNDLIFNGLPWINLHQVLGKILTSVRHW